jgi:CRISPR type I-E-associated protein CasB/Cse2
MSASDSEGSSPRPTVWSVRLRDHLDDLMLVPAFRSDLRASLGIDPARAHRAHRHLARFIPIGQTGSAKEQAVYATAALAAHHPELVAYTDRSSVGALLGRIAIGDSDSGVDMTFQRLQALCRGTLPSLLNRLPGVMAFATSRGSWLDLSQLAWDLAQWDDERDRVIKRWVREYASAQYHNTESQELSQELQNLSDDE